MKRCVIVGASPFSDAAMLKRYLRKEDYIVAADGGCRLLDAMGVRPHRMIGDFDSYALPDDAQMPLEVLPVHKDDTDVFAAARGAYDRGYREFLLLGCLGGRLDHTISNLFLLRFLKDHGANGMLVDEHHEITLLSAGTHVIPPRDGYYLSLLPYGGNAHGVTIEDAEYTVRDVLLDTSFPLGVSNGFIGKEVHITLKDGFLLQILAKKD